jgi:hypothetical protein
MLMAVCFTMQIRSALALMQTIYWTYLYMVPRDDFTKKCLTHMVSCDVAVKNAAKLFQAIGIHRNLFSHNTRVNSCK